MVGFMSGALITALVIGPKVMELPLAEMAPPIERCAEGAFVDDGGFVFDGLQVCGVNLHIVWPGIDPRVQPDFFTDERRNALK